jgi:hypothetical protein
VLENILASVSFSWIKFFTRVRLNSLLYVGVRKVWFEIKSLIINFMKTFV